MELMKTSVEFQVEKMIKEMQRVSRFKIEQGANYIPPHTILFELGLTSFSFGRQSGHTEGICRSVLSSSDKGEATLVVVHNEHFKKDILKKMNGDAGYQRIPSNHVVSIHNLGYAGQNRGLVMPPFYHILVDGPVTHVNGWRERLVTMLGTRLESVKDVVVVGS